MLPDSLVSAEDSSDEAGAPADEIEVTPEMIEAGALVLRGDYELSIIGPTWAEHLSEEILKAGLKIRRESSAI